MKQHRECEICGNRTELSVIKEIKFSLPDSYRISSGYEIVSCKCCGFCYADTLASLDDYNYYYTNYNYYSGEGRIRMPNDIPENTIIDLLNEICTKQDKILDIGFGDGEQLLSLKEKNYENLYGIDPSAESVDHIRKLGISAEMGNIYELGDSIFWGGMDVVIATGVLEHLIKPSLALESIGKILKDNGVLIVTVPNCLNLVNDLSPMSNNFNQEHINYFSPVSLKNLMRKVGFLEEKVIAEERYIDMFAVFRYKKKQTRAFVKDNKTILAIKTYINRQNESEKICNKKVEKYIKNNTPIAVWGTGSYAMSLLSNTDLQYCRIECFIDNNPLKCGSVFGGKPVVSPENITNNTHIEAIIVASIKSAEEINRQLLDLGRSAEEIVLM